MKLRHLFAALLLGVLPVASAHAGFSITIAPPPLVTYEQPVCPAEGYLWTPGYWAYDYDAGDYYWVGGAWVPPPRVGYLWTPGYWGFDSGFYAFNEGYWGPAVGFYGGINYGYGYGGYGYYGGRWDGRVFRYNTAITRVNTNVVHNTYVDKNALRNATSSRASFNGRGGINARPDATQSAAAHASHIRATSAQTKAVAQARTTHLTTARPTVDRRAQAPNSTRNGRATNLVRNSGTARNAPALTNTTSPNGRTAAARNSRNAGNRANPVRTTAHNRLGNPGSTRVSRGPQVARQPKAPQPQRGHAKGGEKKP